jgi:hypothetical protein
MLATSAPLFPNLGNILGTEYPESNYEPQPSRAERRRTVRAVAKDAARRRTARELTARKMATAAWVADAAFNAAHPKRAPLTRPSLTKMRPAMCWAMIKRGRQILRERAAAGDKDGAGGADGPAPAPGGPAAQP